MLQETFNNRNKVLNSLKKRNDKENEPFLRLIKSQNRLFETNNALRVEINELKVTNQKLNQENLDLHKTGGSSTYSAYPHEKLRLLDEQLLKAKDEVIDLQKRLVEQAQQVIQLNKQLKEKNDELIAKDAKINEVENRCETIKGTSRELENRIQIYEETIRLWRDEKVESEVQYNCLLQKYDKLKEDYQQILNASLRFREEQIEKINKQNELDNERLHLKLRDELEKAREEFINVNTSGANMVTVGPLNYSEEFKTTCDWSRAIFSPDIDHQYVSTGSADGSVIIWNSSTAKVEKILKEHNAGVISLCWHPQGNYLVSCDAKKKAVIWSYA